MSLRFLVPAFLICCTFAFLVSLGFWQLDRADQKRAIEVSIQKANTGSVELIATEELLKDKEYYEVRLKGKFINDKQFIYDNQIVDQISGYYVLTPFVLSSDFKTILINQRVYTLEWKKGSTSRYIYRPSLSRSQGSNLKTN